MSEDFVASDILSYNVVQDHEGISIKGYRGLRPPGDLKDYSYEYVSQSINLYTHPVPGMTGHLNLPSSDLCTVWYRTRWYLCDL